MKKRTIKYLLLLITIILLSLPLAGCVEKPTTTTYTVTFESNGGSAVSAQTVEKGKTATKPEDPVRDNFDFDKWYSDPNLENAFDFSTPINDNITLYANWLVQIVDDNIIDLGDVENMINNGQIDVAFDDQGKITTIDGQFTNKTVSSENDAANILNEAKPLLGDNFTASAEEITSQSIQSQDAPQESFFRFAPVINNIPVLGSQVIISTDQNGKTTGLYNTYDDKINNVSTYAYIDQDTANSSALNALFEQEEIDEFISACVTQQRSKETVTASLTELLNVNSSLIIYAAKEDEDPILVYQVNISTKEDIDNQELNDEEELPTMPDIDYIIYVYANGAYASGIYQITNNIHDAWSSANYSSADLKGVSRSVKAQKENDVYRLIDSTRNIETYETKKTTILWWTEYPLPGTIVATNNCQNLASAISAHYNMEQTYDFYQQLGRNSYDGKGAKVITTTQYNEDENAFWTSSKKQFVFEKGEFENALDVVAHEYTHAVSQYIVGGEGLHYESETGALNEAYSDIFGELVEGKSGSDNWLLAEDSQRAIRSLSNPSLYNQPDHYSEFSKDYPYDNGGVHHYSGIFGHAAYTMMTDSRTANISRMKWANVFYRSLYRLSNNATFLDARGAVIASANRLGFNHEQQQAIKDAFDHVGICEQDYIKITLRWGATPSDLDSHLVGPAVNGNGRFHIYYRNKTYYQNDSYYSSVEQLAYDLDYDDTSSYGPEITTIHTLTPGTYYFYVHDYSNGGSSSSNAMALSGANVEVKTYKSGRLTGRSQYLIDSQSNGIYWNVCKITISSNKNITIEPINTYGYAKEYN